MRIILFVTICLVMIQCKHGKTSWEKGTAKDTIRHWFRDVSGRLRLYSSIDGVNWNPVCDGCYIDSTTSGGNSLVGIGTGYNLTTTGSNGLTIDTVNAAGFSLPAYADTANGIILGIHWHGDVKGACLYDSLGRLIRTESGHCDSIELVYDYEKDKWIPYSKFKWLKFKHKKYTESVMNIGDAGHLGGAPNFIWGDIAIPLWMKEGDSSIIDWSVLLIGAEKFDDSCPPNTPCPPKAPPRIQIHRSTYIGFMIQSAAIDSTFRVCYYDSSFRMTTIASLRHKDSSWLILDTVLWNKFLPQIPNFLLNKQ